MAVVNNKLRLVPGGLGLAPATATCRIVVSKCPINASEDSSEPMMSPKNEIMNLDLTACSIPRTDVVLRDNSVSAQQGHCSFFNHIIRPAS